jgi:carbon storage regulator
MLVLSRWPGQSIMIRDDIEITVLSVTSDSVRLGIQAPRRVPVYRKELYLEIAQQRAAAGGSPSAEVDEALKRLSGGD